MYGVCCFSTDTVLVMFDCLTLSRGGRAEVDFGQQKGEHTKLYSRINTKVAQTLYAWPVVLLKGISKKSNLHKVK